MGKVIGIGAVVVGLWCAVEIYTNGTANAFGGALVQFGLADEAEADQSSRDRVRSTATRAHAEADARRERLLAE